MEAINAIHVIDWSDAKRQPVAIAYRTEDTPEIHKKPVAAMSMVLDTSGSMNNALDGGTEGPSRISQLKDTLNDSNTGLFSILEENDVYINLIPFANNANMPHKNLSSYSESEIKKFYNINKDKDKQKLKSMVSSLRADGGTNTGDSLRRAYYQLKDFGTKDIGSVNSNQLIKKYVIVLVDGVTTFGSANINVSKVTYGGVWRGKFNSFFSGSSANIGDTYYTTNPTVTGNKLMEGIYAVDNNTVPRPVGDGANLDKTYGEEYVKLMGNLLAPEIDQAFVIGYSNKKEDGKYVELESLTDIARALRIAVKDTEANEQFKDNKFVFVATDKESLRKAFEDIGGYINEELWQVHGPKLDP